MATAQIRITADTAQAERALGSLNRTLGSLAGIVSVGALAQQFVTLADAATNLQNKLSLVVRDGQSTSQLFDAMAASSLKLAAPIGDITDLFTRLSMNTKELGLSQQDVLGLTETLTMGFQMAGLSVAETSGAVTQLGQAFAAGRVQGDELGSILENLPLVAQSLSERLGVTRGELKKLGADGKISADTLASAIRDSGQAIEDAYGNRIPTISGVFAQLNTVFSVFLQRTNAGGQVATVLATALLRVINVILEFADSMNATTSTLSEVGALLWDVAVLVGTFFAAFRVFKFIVPLVESVGAAIVSLFNTIRTAGGLFKWLEGGLASVGGFFRNLGVSIDWFGTLSVNVFQLFRGAFVTIYQTIVRLFPSLGSRFTAIGNLVRTVFAGIAAFFIATQERIIRIYNRVGTLTGWYDPIAASTENATSAAADYNSELERLQGNLGITGDLSAMTGPNLTGNAGAGAAGSGAAQETTAQKIAAATAERNKQYQELIKTQQDGLYLTQFEGVELEIQSAILSANNQLIKDITDSKGKVVGQTQGLNALERENLSTLIRQNAEAKARVEVTRTNTQALAEAGLALRTATMTPSDAAVEDAIFKNRQQYGTAYTAELEAQDRIMQRQIVNLNQQAQVARVLNDITRSRTELEVAQAASSMYGSTMEGMLQQQQQQLEALNLLREQELISEQSFLDQKILINQAAQDAILQYEQKIAALRMQQAGVTNTGIIQSVQDMQAQVAMMQQGGIVGAQGVLGALTNIMGSMGQVSEKAFKAYKALAIAQAIISTYQAAAMALASPPGPPISYIYVASAIASGIAQVAQIRKQQYQGRALGGPVMGDKPYIVGERGPELFVPQGTGSIVRNGDAFGGGGAPLTVQFNILANDTTGFDELLSSRRGLITQIIRDAQLEQGQRM